MTVNTFEAMHSTTTITKGSVQPLVSVVTPVYNGGKYLRACIESVVNQTYKKFEYIIVNNCSTDDTLAIATSYAERDKRIRVVNNRTFVDVIANHNIAFRFISNESDYCKVVSADDWLMPECLEKLVALANHSPEIAMVGSYATSDSGLVRVGLPDGISVFAGRDVCRLYLLGSIQPFGTPSTVLYRASLVRARERFYPGTLPNADLAACLTYLENAKFGFVDEPLSFERKHSEAVGATLYRLNSFFIDRIQFLDEFGDKYLSNTEIESRREQLLSQLYRDLAFAVFRRQVKGYWQYQRDRLRPLGYNLYGRRMALAMCGEVASLLSSPRLTLKKIARSCRRARVS